MKRISCIILVSVFMASCGDVATSNATVSPQATLTFTPTLTPTITPTPTETPDPNKPSDAMGRDSSTGEYTKTVEENGRTRVYVWKQFQFGDDAKNSVNGHWFKSWMENGPINLTESGGICREMWGDGFTLDMNVYAVEGLADLDKIGYIFHPDRESEWKKYEGATWGGLSCTSMSLPNTITDDLFLRYMDLLSGEPGDRSLKKHEKLMEHYYPGGNLTGDGAQRYTDDRQAYVKAMNNGATIKVGDELWIPQKGYEFYWIDEAMAENDLSMHLSLQAGNTKNFYWKVMVKDGKLIAFIAPAKWLKEQLAWPKASSRERMFNSMTLFPLDAVIAGANTNENISFFPFQDYQGITGVISATINGNSVYIDIPFIDFTSDK